MYPPFLIKIVCDFQTEPASPIDNAYSCESPLTLGHFEGESPSPIFLYTCSDQTVYTRSSPCSMYRQGGSCGFSHRYVCLWDQQGFVCEQEDCDDNVDDDDDDDDDNFDEDDDEDEDNNEADNAGDDD